jgi:hypothetical protein
MTGLLTTVKEYRRWRWMPNADKARRLPQTQIKGLRKSPPAPKPDRQPKPRKQLTLFPDDAQR